MREERRSFEEIDELHEEHISDSMSADSINDDNDRLEDSDEEVVTEPKQPAQEGNHERAPSQEKKKKNRLVQAARSTIKKGAKTLGKKLMKLASKKFVALLGKALAAIIGYVGIPIALVASFLIIIIICAMMISTSVVGNGEAAEEFGVEAQELNKYVTELAHGSIDQNKPEQFMYRVPEQLLAAIVQMDALTKEFEEEGNKNKLKDYKKILEIFADKLKPQFQYETFTETTETRTQSCDKDGKNCKWETSTSTRQVTQLVSVTAWNGNMSASYEKQSSGWSGGDPQTKETYYAQSDYKFEYDYSMLDAILNQQGYKENDKQIFEMLYESATGTPMYYIAWLNGHEIGFEDGCFTFDGNVIPGAGVPPQYMPHYLSASQKYGVPWEYLAGIHRVETNFSTNLSTSYAGAVGHTQFMPCTWVGWSYAGCNGTLGRGSNIDKQTLTSLSMIKKYGGYGVDANGDGKADPMQIEDALHSTAKYLKAHGMPSNPKKAIRAYNHSDKYVADVLKYAQQFKSSATTVPSGDLGPSGTGTANFQAGWKATAYAPALGGINGGHETASGTRVTNGRTIAVDPKYIPLGSIVAIKVPGMPAYSGVYVAEDTGGAIKKKKIDIAIAPNNVKQFGVRNIQVAILRKGGGVNDARKVVASWGTQKNKWEKMAGVASNVSNGNSGSGNNGGGGINNGYFPLPKGQYDKFSDTWGDGRNYGGNRTHEGNDIMAKSGVPIHSATDGKVIKYGWNKLGGWRVTIQSPDGYQLYYAHMKQYAPGISKGASVKRGQLIGYVGDTGYGPEGTTGKFAPHLHFGIYQKGKAINPYPYLKAWEKGAQVGGDTMLPSPCMNPNGGTGDLPPITSGDFMTPTTGRLTSGFGNRTGGMHFGVDIAKRGSNVAVVAAADGVVVKSYFSDTYGNCVIIRHNINGVQYETLYAHMRNRAVSPNTTVKKGTFLGNMGNTGASDGQHLHFEVHQPAWTLNKKNAINPLKVISIK